MESIIEIGYNKKMVIPILCVIGICIVGTTCYAFFSSNATYFTQWVYIPINIFFIYTLYVHIKKLRQNQPVLIISKDMVQINDSSPPVLFLRTAMTSWKIELNDDGYFLFIETADTKHKTNISWLEKPPTEIEKIFQEYIGS